MSAPERIHITWNGADAVDSFREAGVEMRGFLYRDVSIDEIFEVLLHKHTQLFRVLGRTAAGEEVILKIVEMDTASKVLNVESSDEPAFSGDYVIDEGRVPLVTRDTDLLFDIVEANL